MEYKLIATDMDGTLQMLVSNIDYDDYVGRIAVGRVERGTIKKGMQVAICKRDDKIEKATITKIEVYQGLNKVTVEEGQAGDIITLSGINNINIGETIERTMHSFTFHFSHSLKLGAKVILFLNYMKQF